MCLEELKRGVRLVRRERREASLLNDRREQIDECLLVVDQKDRAYALGLIAPRYATHQGVCTRIREDLRLM